SEEGSRESVAALVSQVRNYLEPRRLLATRLHVVEPFFLWIRVRATLHMLASAGESLRTRAPESALERLRAYFSPPLGGGRTGGGPLGDGWPFGRALYLSEVYERLERVEGVDYVDDVDVLGVSTREDVRDERARVGIKVGRSTVGVDSRFGADAAQGRNRV